MAKFDYFVRKVVHCHVLNYMNYDGFTVEEIIKIIESSRPPFFPPWRNLWAEPSPGMYGTIRIEVDPGEGYDEHDIAEWVEFTLDFEAKRKSKEADA